LFLDFSFQFYLAVPNQCFVLHALFDFVYVHLFVIVCLHCKAPSSISPKRNLAPSFFKAN
jgi:hypothetical protein